jgi:hypothetical protein
MSAPETRFLQSLGTDGNGLRATFFWRVDRYAHRIERIEAGAASLLLESIEGSDLDRWPPSPPLQQLSFEHLPDGRPVALLVGMAGSSHWSMSVEAPQDDPGGIVFDVACRVKEDSAALSSAYRSAVRQELAEGAALLHRPGGTGSPAILELLETSPPGAAQIVTDGRGVEVRVSGAEAGRTARWKYRVRVEKR